MFVAITKRPAYCVVFILELCNAATITAAVAVCDIGAGA